MASPVHNELIPNLPQCDALRNSQAVSCQIGQEALAVGLHAREGAGDLIKVDGLHKALL